MGLVHPADGEGLHDPFVGPLAGHRVLVVEGALMLVDHDAVLPQGLVTVAVELPGKQPLAGAERVGGIHDDQVIRILKPADVFQTVLVVDVHPGIVQLAGGLGQVFPADLHHLGVDLHHVDGFDLRVAGQLPDHAAVPGADHQHPPHMRVYRHWHMGDHFVVDELVLFGEHHVAVQRQKPAELRRFKHVDALEFALPAVQLLIHPDGQLYVGGLRFGKPELHPQYSPFSTFSRRISASSGPVMEQPLALAYSM